MTMPATTQPSQRWLAAHYTERRHARIEPVFVHVFCGNSECSGQDTPIQTEAGATAWDADCLPEYIECPICHGVSRARR